MPVIPSRSVYPAGRCIPSRSVYTQPVRCLRDMPGMCGVWRGMAGLAGYGQGGREWYPPRHIPFPGYWATINITAWATPPCPGYTVQSTPAVRHPGTGSTRSYGGQERGPGLNGRKGHGQERLRINVERSRGWPADSPRLSGDEQARTRQGLDRA